MKRFHPLYIVLLTAAFISSALYANAQQKPYDELLTDDVIYFQHTTVPQEEEFPNAANAVYKWAETLDDILEWRVLKSEWTALTEQLGGGNNALGPLCGDDYAYAISGFGDGGKIPTIIYLSYVNDPNKTKQVMSELVEYIASVHDIIQTEHDQFRGYDIHSVYGPGNIPGLGLSYTVQDDLLIVTTSKPYLAGYIDEMGFVDNTLAKSGQYQDAVNRLAKNRTSMTYLNLNEFNNTLDVLLEMGKAIQAAEPDEDAKLFLGIAEEVLGYLKKVKYYATANTISDDHVHANTGMLRYDPSLKDTPFGTLLDNEPVRFDFASYLPRKTGTFQASNIYTIPKILNLLNTFTEDIPEKAEINKSIAQFEEDTGIKIEEETFSWLGDEWCFVKPVMDLEAVVPTNEMAVLITIRDKDKAQEFLHTVQSLITGPFQLPVSPKTTNHRGTEITTFTLPLPVIPFAPSWALNDDIFILASHDSMIREMLDIKAGAGRGIDRNRYYNQLKQYTDKPSNFTSFQDLESEFYTYREAIKRVSSITDLSKEFMPEGEVMPFRIMNRVSYLISCMQIMKATVKRHQITQDELRMESYTFMQDLSSVPNLQSITREKFSLGGKDAIIDIAGFLVTVGQNERAKRIYDILADFYPDDKSYMLDAAEAFQASGDTEKAKDLYSEAVQTSNQPSLFIELASMEDFESANDVESWLHDLTRNKPDFNSDAVLMGVALNASKQGHDALADDVYKLLLTKGDDGVFQSAAKTQLGETNRVTIPLVDTFPTIDGMMDDAWGSEAKDSLAISSEDEAFTLHLSRSGAQLYGLAEKETDQEDIKDETLTLYLCTNNHYNPVRVISIQLSSENGTSSTVKQAQSRVIDHWDLFSDQHTENLNTGWPVAQGSNGDGSVIEFSVPFSILTGEEYNDEWSVNAKYVIEYENGNKVTSWLVDSSAPDDPFGYIPISLE